MDNRLLRTIIALVLLAIPSAQAADLSYGNKYAIVTPAGALKVDASAVTQPVSGTFWQTTQPVSGTFYQSVQPVSQSGGWSTSVTNFPATQPVSGTFWQATQPVSLLAMPTTPVTGSFWQATQPVSGTFWQTTQPVSIGSMPSTPVTGTFWQATQPISIASMPSTPVTGTFFQATQPVSIAAMPSTPVTGTFWQATQPISGTVTAVPQPATLYVSSVGIAGSAITASLAAVSSQFHYITLIEITAYTTVARVGSVTPVTVTTTDLPGSIAYTFATAAVVGSTDVKTYVFNQPLKSSTVNTATTIVCPATASVIWRVNISYYAAT